ncbi:MAG: PEGA domain-containing protein [Melioribacteraceae bacterium]|nr:PEGA domain-containing protein [Melioribacteraceae bacterium]
MKFKKTFYFISLVCLVIISCETNPPSFSEFDDVKIKLAVVSNIDGASIFIDDVFSGKFTPDTILTDLGTHKITLTKEGFLSNSIIINVGNQTTQSIFIELVESKVKKTVLIEDFANVSCDPCVISNKIIKNLAGKFDDQIAVIKFSTNFPSPTDPFYLSNKSSNDSRMSFYDILFAPTIIIDGINRPIPTDSNEVISAIEARLNNIPQFKIEVSDSISNNTMYVKGKVVQLIADIELSEFRLFSSIVEEHIVYNSPPGSNGEKEFHDVLRALLPNDQGHLLIENEDDWDFIFSSDLSSEWNINDLKSITFIQNVSTKEIVQTAVSLH